MSELDKDSDKAEPQRLTEPWPSPGRKLRELRESLGLTQGQVGESLHLTMHYINALENDLYEKLPGRTFAKGYLKSYAALVGADVDDIIERFEKVYEEREERVVAIQRPMVRQRRTGEQGRGWIVAAGLLLVAFVGAAWWFGTGDTRRLGATAPPVASRADTPVATTQQQTRPAPRATSAEALISRSTAVQQQGAGSQGAATDGFNDGDAGAPSDVSGDTLALATPEQVDEGNVPARQAGASAGETLPQREERTTAEGARIISLNTPGEDLLVLRLAGRSWVEVHNSEDTRLYYDNMNEGDQLTVRGQAPFNLLLGNASSVRVEFNSEHVDLTPVIRGDNTARLTLEP